MTITTGILYGMTWTNGLAHIREIKKMDERREEQTS